MRSIFRITGAVFLIALQPLCAAPAPGPDCWAAGQSAPLQRNSARGANAGQVIEALRARLNRNPDDVQALAALANWYVEAGALTQAEPLLARAVKLKPQSEALRIRWAAVLARLHRYAEAETALKGMEPPHEPAKRIGYWRIKGSIALAEGHQTAAAQDMENALAVDPEDAQMRLAAGLAEIEARRWRQAIQALRPVFDSTHNARAGLALLEAEIAARQDASRTLTILDGLALPAADDARLRVRIGRILIHAGMKTEAVGEFERAVKESPPDAGLLYDLALAQFEAGHAAAALASALRAKSLADSAEIESLLGDILEKQGDSLEAVESYQAAVRLDPGNEQCHLALGLELLQHRTFHAALLVFRDATQQFPHSARLRIALGVTKYLLEDYAGAAQELMAAAKPGKDAAIAYQYLGETQLEQPAVPDSIAIKQLCSYSDSHQGDGRLLAYCGALEARAAREKGAATPPPDALRRLEEATRLDPEDAIARCELGKAEDGLKQWQAARENLEACARLQPDSAEVHYRLARVCQALGDRACAGRQLKLHDAAVESLVSRNAERDRTLQKFLFTIESDSAH
jgi:tetratricopeptide (TPR) repeat protein